ncbi:MAG: enoyl-CoA hydratase [Pseudomonadota bacterium]
MSERRTTSSPHISYIMAPPIGTIVLDHPARRNALSLDMWQALPEAIAALEADSSIRAILLKGEGDAFAAGADISEFTTHRKDAASARAYEQINVAAFRALSDAARPTIAAIHGFCMGGGMGLAAACDLRIAQDDAVFAVPAARLGLGYPVDGVVDVLSLIGRAKTLDLVMTARRVGAHEAKEIGFLDYLVPEGALDEEAATLARTISQNAPLSIRAIRNTTRALIRAGMTDELRAELAALVDACYDSRDYHEGVAAFLEKRHARFHGE